MNNNKLDEVKEDMEILKVLENLLYNKISNLINNELQMNNFNANIEIEVELKADIIR